MIDPADSCSVCGNPGFTRLCTKHSFAGKPIDIVRCSSCRLLRAHPFPDDAALEAFYNDGYFNNPAPLAGGYENYDDDTPQIKDTYRRHLRFFLPSLSGKADPRALDVGCASGVFLEVLREAGWQDLWGVELSTFGVEHARSKKLHILKGRLEEVALPPASFDLISLWDVIEHVRDPLDTLTRCFDLLKPGGYLVMSTPDASAPLARLLGNYWLGFRSVGEHLYFFGRETMRTALEKSGFETPAMRGIGKYMLPDRVLTRLAYYTRIFRWAQHLLIKPLNRRFYIYSGDTMCVVARRPAA